MYKVTQDYAIFNVFSKTQKKTDVPENFESLGLIVQPLGQFQIDNFLKHTTTLTQHSTKYAEGRQPSLDRRLDKSFCYSLACE